MTVVHVARGDQGPGNRGPKWLRFVAAGSGWQSQLGDGVISGLWLSPSTAAWLCAQRPEAAGEGLVPVF